MNLLLVEDNEAYVELLMSLLEPFRCAFASSGRLAEGLRLASTGQFNVILLDLQLTDSTPEHTVEAIPQFRALQPDAAIVVMSAHVGRGHRKRAIELGADQVVDKSEHAKKNALLVAIVMSLMHHPVKRDTPTFISYVEMLEEAVKQQHS